MKEVYKSRVYTDRPPYADFDSPEKFEAIKSIIARRLTEHPKAICSYSGGADSDIMIDLIEKTRTIFGLPPYSQTIQPFEFGHPYSKKTCLWLKNLSKLEPTNILDEYKPYISCGTSQNKGNKDKSGFSRAGGSSKIRSKTFPGIARAMAEQWGK